MAINRVGYNGAGNIEQPKETQAEQTKASLPPTPVPTLEQPSNLTNEKFARRRSMKGELLRDQIQTKLDERKIAKTTESIGQDAQADWRTIGPPQLQRDGWRI